MLSDVFKIEGEFFHFQFFINVQIYYKCKNDDDDDDEIQEFNF
jgi:hypothetical protein